MLVAIIMTLFLFGHVTCIKAKTVQSEEHDQQTSLNWSVPMNRHKRSGPTDYYIDIAAVIDYKLYSTYPIGDKYSHIQAAKNINEHYAFVFAGVDKIFQEISGVNFRIHIRLCKVYITQISSASYFIDHLTTDDSISAETALPALAKFVTGDGRGFVGRYDHVMLFTGYDVKIDGDRKFLGSTLKSKMCNTDGSSVSIIEDRSGYFIINSVAQLLAYSLSADNDGENNACSPSDRYIMGSDSSPTTISNKFNPWQFSSCSIASFSNFLKTTVDTSRGYTCLGFFLDVNADIPDVSGRLLGQEVNPDQQCRQRYGSNSFYARYSDMATLSDICSGAMYCKSPDNENQYYTLPALFGTSCGDGKMCINGQCVSDPFAPQVNENCVFGDRQCIVYESLTCSQFITNQNGQCYNDVNYHICCSSCNKVYKPILGCEYGDNLTGCQPENCLLSKTQCCKTCNYGTPFTPTTTTQRTTPVRTTYLPVPWPTIKSCNIGDPDLVPGICTSPSVCQTQRTFCCSYCSRVSSATVPGKVALVHLILYTLVLYYLLN